MLAHSDVKALATGTATTWIPKKRVAPIITWVIVAFFMDARSKPAGPRDHEDSQAKDEKRRAGPEEECRVGQALKAQVLRHPSGNT